MARLATESDFHGARTGNPDALYTDYRRYPFFAQRAALLVERYPAAVTILVAGCGPGYLVDELIALGRTQAWGVDGAAYAVSEAGAALPPERASHIVILGTGANAVRTAKLAMGLTVNQLFDLCVTEDVLPCGSPAEQAALLTQLRAHATQLFHIVTPGDPADPAKLPGVDWKSIAGWRAVIGPGEPILDAETWEVSE